MPEASLFIIETLCLLKVSMELNVEGHSYIPRKETGYPFSVPRYKDLFDKMCSIFGDRGHHFVKINTNY